MKEFILEILEVELKENIILKESIDIASENLKYHLENDLSVSNSIYRYSSNKHLELIDEVRKLYDSKLVILCENDEELIKSDAGLFGLFEGEKVPLDLPFEEYEENVEENKKNIKLNKPKRGGSKKFYVYVKNPKTKKIQKVSFGAKEGGGKLAVKLKDPKARKRFADRHNCEQKNDKTTPGYWSCRLPRYAKMLGLSGSGKWW
tara:strand:+ start:226 stop:837 length:612 start_codon:yes stop_codon:yes gene_type:complete